MAHRVLIAGCGDLGNAVAERLLDRGFEVSGLRRSIPTITRRYQLIAADVTNPASLHEVASLAPEVLIYSVAATEQSDENYRLQYVQGLSDILQALAGVTTLKHVFFVSSTRVYGQQTEEILDESVIPKPADFGGERLLEAERLLLSLHIPATVLRLSGIYGPGRTRMLRLAQVPGSWPEVNVWTNRIHRDDAAGFITCLTQQVLQGVPVQPCYIVSDSLPVAQYEVLSWLARQIGVEANLASRAVSGGKRLSNHLMLASGYVLQYPDYRSGYATLLT